MSSGLGRRPGKQSQFNHCTPLEADPACHCVGLLYGSLGYYGGRVFEDQPHLALAVALGIAFAVTAVVELAQ
jgi:hypothetical protein